LEGLDVVRSLDLSILQYLSELMMLQVFSTLVEFLLPLPSPQLFSQHRLPLLCQLMLFEHLLDRWLIQLVPHQEFHGC